jgi:hypothetical protein
MNALSARSSTGQGGEAEVIMLEPGWIRLDPADPATGLPLGTGTTDVVLLAEFPRTNDAGTTATADIDRTTLAIISGDGTTANTQEMWRIRPSTGLWQQVAHSNFAATTRPKGDREALPDWTVFAAGAPARTDYTSGGGNGIDQPAFIWTNNVDPVYVYPADSTTPTVFEDLTADAALAPFYAKSVEVYNNRVYFLNTSENGTRYLQRVRRTPPFTCDPAIAGVGSGSVDLKDFSDEGLRLMRLGNVLVAYFKDGVAFIRGGGPVTNPDAYQSVSTSRGLISSHSVANLGNDLHFGIFTDGWYELDPSGRFREVGVVDLGGGQIAHKWRDTFYDLLGKEPDKRNRLYIEYDPPSNKVYIALPTDDEDDNERVWIYDRTADRVFLDEYPVTCWGRYTRQITSSLTYAAAATAGPGGTELTYDSIAPATYASLGNIYGIEALAHGTLNGYVFQHEPGTVSRDKEASTGNEVPTYVYETHYKYGSSPRFLLSADRVLVEYSNLNGPNLTAIVASSGSVNESVSLPMTTGNVGDLNISSDFYRFTGQQLNLRLTGVGPVLLKSFELDLFQEEVEPR